MQLLKPTLPTYLSFDIDFQHSNVQALFFLNFKKKKLHLLDLVVSKVLIWKKNVNFVVLKKIHLL